MNSPTLQFVKSVSERFVFTTILIFVMLVTAFAENPENLQGGEEAKDVGQWYYGDLFNALPMYSSMQNETGYTPLSPPPVAISCPPDVVKNTITTACFASHSWMPPSPGAGNHLELFFNGVSQEHPAIVTNSGIFPQGITTVTYEEHDGAEGVVSTCSFTIEVRDNVDPSFSGCPSDIEVDDLDDNCNEQVFWTPPTPNDNCSNTVTSNFVSGNVFNVGTTVVTYTNTDGSIYSNDATCSFNVIVHDVTPPVIACPGNDSKNVDPGFCYYTVSGTEFDATATDNCGVLIYSYMLSGATTGTNYGSLDGVQLNLGVTTISWAVDDGENMDMCSFDVEVIDNEDPTAVCPAAPTVQLDGSGNGSLAADALIGNSTDNCSVVSETSPATAFGCGDIGTQQVMLTVVDAAGLSHATMCDVIVEGPVVNNNSGLTYCSINAAVAAATPGDDIELRDNITEGQVTLNKEIILDGGGFTLTSTSGSYGVSIQSPDVTIENITVEGAGTFGIHQSSSDNDDLTIINTTTNSNGGTGIALNCASNIILTDIISTNNGGNGVSITDCHNVTITNITTSGNTFGSFGAGVGIFTSTYCTPGSSSIVIDGTVSIAENPAVYEEIGTNGGTITGVTLPMTYTHFVGIATSKFYYTSLSAALDAADQALAADGSYQPFTYVEEIATGDHFVAPKNTAAVDMSIQAAIDYAASGITVNVYAGTFTENVDVTEHVKIIGAGSGIGGTIITETGGSDGVVDLMASGVSAADPLLLQDLRIQPVGKAGVSVGTFTMSTGTMVSFVKMENVHVLGTATNPCTEQERGLYVDLTSSLTDLEIINSAFSSLTYGWYLQKKVDGVDMSTVSDVTVTNTDFNGNLSKGIYAEKLEEATFTNCNFTNNGAIAADYSACSYFTPWKAGIDINLKDGTYQNLTFDGCTITGNAIAEAKEGVGITVKARDDGGTYGTYPATVSGVSITDCTITGNERGIRIGEPGKDNDTPLMVLVEGCNISGNVQQYSGADGSAYGGLINMTDAAAPIDADDNWWGDVSGPYNEPYNTCGLGDAVVGNVDFEPWCADLNCTTTSTGAAERTVQNSSIGTSYCTIQDAIDDPLTVDGNTIQVGDGTYVEDIIVNKELIILGPNASNCGTGSRVDEAIIYPATSSPFGEIIKVQASNVTIAGFLIDGDNSALSSGIIGTNGADLDAAEAVTVYVDNVQNLTVENNIIQNLTYFGVTIFGSSYSAPATSGHLVDCNKFQDLGTYLDPGNDINFWGGGVLIYNDQYTRITNNTMMNVRIGVQTGNFHDPNPGTADYQVIDGNTIQTRRRGIFYNLHTGNPAPLTVSNNNISGVADGNETDWDGILLSSLSDAVGIVTNNNIDGTSITIASQGIEVWNVNANSPVSITGGMISNVNKGLFLNNYEGYNSDAGNGAHAHVSGISISPNSTGTGIHLLDSPSSTGHADVRLELGTGVAVTGGTDGLVIENANAALVDVPVADGYTDANDLDLDGQTGDYIKLINNAFDVDGTAVTFDGNLINATTRPAIEAKVYHQADDPALGLVIPLLPCNVPEQVTNLMTGEIFCTIQEAIDDVDTDNGDVIEVSNGTYMEAITVNKGLTIQGANVGTPGSGVRITESILLNSTINVTTSETVVIDGFKVERDDAVAGDMVLLAGGAEATITNTIFERNGSAAGTNVRAILSSAGAGVKTISNNLFTGDDSGGLFSGHKTWNNAIYINGAGSTVNILNNQIENSRTGLNLDDYQAGLSVSGNTFENNGTHVSFGGTTPTNGQFTFGANDFMTSASAIINLSNVDPAFRLDITSSSYNGAALTGVSDATLFEVEAQMFHKERSVSKKGKVIYRAGNQYVNNFTIPSIPYTKIDVIQNSVLYADANDIINLQDGTYNQSVVIDVPNITLQGVTTDKSLYIIDGAGLPPVGTGAGSRSGIKINNGITGISIKNLTVQNFNGASGNLDAGIYGVGGNNNLLVDKVALLNNTNGSGFYANGPVDGVTINESMVSGHTVGARGIVIWNGLKENITFTNNMVTNNSCCGIELQDGTADMVTISGNTVDVTAGDSGMGLTGMSNAVVHNNTVTGVGRFGIEIKNPNGNVNVTDNTVTNTGAANDRDYAGIAVFRRAVLGGTSGPDIPFGVTLTGNTVTGFMHAGPVAEGFGIVVEGVEHVVSGNTLNGNDIGIQLQGGGHENANYPAGDGDQAAGQSPNYFGRGNTPTICETNLGMNTFSGNGANVRLVTGSEISVDDIPYITTKVSGTIYNQSQDTYHCTIQDAIDNSNGTAGSRDIILVPDGIYREEIVISKDHFELRGNNYGVDPCTDTRIDESVIMAPRSDPDPYSATGVYLMYFDGLRSDVVIEGFTFEGDNPDFTSGVVFGGADVDAVEALSAYDGISDVMITNNIIQNLGYSAIDFASYGDFPNTVTGGTVVSHNKIDNLQPASFGIGIIMHYNAYVEATENCISNVNVGIQTGNFYDEAPVPGTDNIISNNTVSSNKIGIWHNVTSGDAERFVIENNTITANESTNQGIKLTSLSGVDVLVQNNDITGGEEGIEVWNCSETADVQVKDNTISGAETGIFVNNYEGYNSNAGNTQAVIENSTISGATAYGIRVLDSPDNTNGSTVFAEIMEGNDISSSGVGISVEGADASADIHDNPSSITMSTTGVLVDGGNATISTTSIHDNTTGILFQNGGTGTVNNNNIYDNDDGLINTTGVDIDATLNWWGDITGPNHPVTNPAATGNSVSDDVIYCPWLDDVFTTGQPAGPVQVMPSGEYFCSIQEAIDDAGTNTGDIITVNAGIYTEVLMVTKGVIIQGPNASIAPLCSGARPNDEAVIETADGTTPITVGANGVTIDGFTITNPDGGNAIVNSGYGNFEVKNNIVASVGNNSLSGATHAIAVTSNANAISVVKIEDNRFTDIHGGEDPALSGTAAKNNNGSGSAIGIGWSNANNDVTGLSIQRNCINNVSASAQIWDEGGKGAYGIIINVGYTGAGQVVSPQIIDNEIDNLGGLWSHGIGLEGDTPNAMVQNNAISNLTDNKTELDAAAIMVEGNASASSVSINYNSFVSVEAGIRNVTGLVVDGTCNWWNTMDLTTISGMIVGPVTASPFLTDGTDGMAAIGFQPSGACDGEFPILNATRNLYFTTIQNAIDDDNTQAGDIIEILPNDFTEPAQVNVYKSITLMGQGKLVTTLRPGVSTGNSGDARGFILVQSGIEFHLEDLTLNGDGFDIYQGIRQKGFGTIDNVYFTKIQYPGYGGVALAAFGTGNVHVTNSMFDQIGRIGVLYFGTGISGSNFTDNTYTGKGAGDWLDYALDISAGAVVNASENTISGNRGVASSDGSTSAAILVTTFFGGGTTAIITNNQITDNTTGVAVGYDGTDTSIATINNNNIYGNDYGVTSTGPQVDATSNWWGDASGPLHPVTNPGGLGNEVSDNVAYCPWLDNVFATGQEVGPVYNVDTDMYFCSIQEAIDDGDTDAGDMILVGVGTYSETVTVSKGVILKGPNVGVAPCAEARTAEAIVQTDGSAIPFSIAADGATIDGFTITNPDGNYAVYNNGYDNLTLQNNIITSIGNNRLEGNTHAVYVRANSDAVAGLTIMDNQFYDIHGGEDDPATSNGSASAIFIGDTNSNNDVTGASITENCIELVRASTADFVSGNLGGKGAYGVLIGVGASGTGSVVDADILRNEIKDLEGLWAHGIGLEGRTPGAEVLNNDLSDIVDHKDPSDAVAVLVEDNDGVGTVMINYNSFTNVDLGVWNKETTVVDATCNYWDTTDPGTIYTKYNGPVTASPFLTNGIDASTDIGFQPTGACDGDFPVLNVNKTLYFASIQAAIDDVNTEDNDVIRVLPANFTEPGQVHVTKSLTIEGQGKLTTTVHSNVNTTTAGHGVTSAAWIYTDPGTEVHFREMTLDATGQDTKYGVVFKDAGSLTNVAINEIKHSSSPYLGIAVQVLDGNVDVTGCMFTQIGRIGVHYRNGVISGASISGIYDDNMYTGKGVGDWLDYALDISGGVNVTVSNSIISGNRGVASTDGSTSGGILVTTYFPYGQNLANNVLIVNNELTDNTTGVAVGFDANDVSVAVINNNNIYGNDYGVTSTGPQVDATSNWWGDASGPSGQGPGTGDAVSVYVDFCPWLDDEWDAMGVGTNALVTNTDTGEEFCTIQEAIDAPMTMDGHHISISAGIYPEHVTVHKDLTLTGAGEGLTVLEGTGLGIGNGITLASGQAGITIEQMTIQNYTGSGSNGSGIFGLNNDDFILQHVTLDNNQGRGGIYLSGVGSGIDNVLIDNVTSSNHAVSGSRGIVIWNGHKTNITISNCEVFNNNCCGIELQDGTASDVTITGNNIHDNVDNGIGVLGLTDTEGSNSITGNTVTDNGRFGIEIKNPNGGVTVSGNTVSIAASAGMNIRDHAGIAVFRRSFQSGNPDGYADIPNGVTVSGNTVSGYRQLNPGKTTSEGFGIVIEGVDHTVTGNILDDNDVALQLQGGGHPNANYTYIDSGDGDQADGASAFYFGRGNAPILCNVAESGNSFGATTANDIDRRMVIEPMMPITDNGIIDAQLGTSVTLDDGTTQMTYCSIQAAIDDATGAGNETIIVAPGTYTGALDVDKDVTLEGPNVGVAPCTESRTAEALIQTADGTTPVTIGTDGVSIDGFNITNPDGNYAIYNNGYDNLIVQNNIIDHIGNNAETGNTHSIYVRANSDPVIGLTITDNQFYDIHGGEKVPASSNGSASAIFIGDTNAGNDVTGVSLNENCIELVRASTAPFVSGNLGGKGAYGILIGVGASGAGSVPNADIMSNDIKDLEGLWAHGIGLEGRTPGAEVFNNDLNNIVDHKDPSDAVAVLIEDNDGAGTVLVNNNSFTNVDLGVWNKTGNLVDATCNYWDTTDPIDIFDKYNGLVTATPFLTNGTDDSADIGFQPVAGSCDGDFPILNVDEGLYFPSIQAAIDDTNTDGGDVIRILPADFTEPGQVVVNKSVIIEGLGKASTTLRSNYDTASGGHDNDQSAWILTEPGTDVTIREMTIDATGKDTYTAVRFKDDGAVTNIAFNQIKHSASPYLGIAVQVQDGNVDVTGCMFTQIGRIGVHYRNGVISGAAISGLYHNNMYTGKGMGNWLDYALDISGGVDVTVSNSTISNNIGVAASDGSTSAGILVTTYFPAGQNLANDVTIENNNLSGNTTGVAVGFDGSDASVVVINNNDIYNNDFGVTSTGPQVDATSNWWGDVTGPQHPTANPDGMANPVSDYVDICPWLDASYTVPGMPVDVVPVAVCGSDFSVLLDANGVATINPSDLDGGSYDPCETPALSLDISTFGCGDLGVNTITLTATDAAMQSTSCTVDVTVLENIPTIVDCPDDIVVDNDAGECGAVVSWTPPTSVDVRYNQGFEDAGFTSGSNSGDWQPYGGDVVRVISGTDLITSASGTAHGIATGATIGSNPELIGPYTRLGGYSTDFGTGYVVSIDIYMDLDDPAVTADTYGWDLSVAANDQAGSHLQDFIFHTASNVAGNILVGGSNNTNFTRRNDLASINHHEITISGWYTFQWVFRDDGAGILAVDLNLVDNTGTILWTETRSDAGNIINTVVGGNRYMWFTFIETDQLPVDNVTLEKDYEIVGDFSPDHMFPVGTTTVTYTATGACGTEVTCQFDVIVNDAEAPLFVDCPVDMESCADSPTVSWTHVELTDNCDLTGGSLSYTLSGATEQTATSVAMFDGSTMGAETFNEGVTTVTYSAMDAAGNPVGNTCSFTVTINPLPDFDITADYATWAETPGNTASVPDAGSGATYNWVIANMSGVIDSGNGTNTISFTSGNPGTVELEVTVTDGNTCSSMAMATVIVLDPCNSPDFSEPVTLAPNGSEGVGLWSVDRFEPEIFDSQATAPDGTLNTLHHGIDASDGQASGFHNTQGRRYAIHPTSIETEIELFIPADWATSGKRMAGFWGEGFDNTNALSAYPIIEFTSDAGNPRFRGWEDNGTWYDMGLPAGFVYDQWVTLRLQLLASGEFRYTVKTAQGDLIYNTTTHGVNGSTHLENIILQGHNTTAGVTYDIYWNNQTASPVDFDMAANGVDVQHFDTVTYCYGEQIDFDITGPNSADTYTLVFDGNTISSGNVNDPTVSISGITEDDAGAYELTVVNDDGCSLTEIYYVVVKPAPTIDCIADQTRNTDVGTCTYTVDGTEFDPVVTGDCTPLVLTYELTGATATGVTTANTLNGLIFYEGTTIVTWTVTDAATPGNVTTCSFEVVVEDNEAPAMTCPADIVSNSNPSICGNTEFWTNPTATDNCTLTPDLEWDIYDEDNVLVSHQTGLTAGSGVNYTFGVGENTVTYTATDESGNPFSCSFTVTINDMADPTISGCPSDLTIDNQLGQCGAIATWIAPTASDNCTGVLLTSTHSPGSFFDVGTTTVTYTATDASSNTTTCSFDVTVVDNEDPVITCPADITVTANPGDCDATVTFTAPVGTDNCMGATTTQTDMTGLSSGSLFPAGTTMLEFTVTDAASNDASCMMSITVSTAPVAVDDESLANPPGPVTLNVVTNDTDCDSNIDVSTVDLAPSTMGQQTSLMVPMEGTWSVNASGEVTFTPEVGFTHDPAPISYTVGDGSAYTSNEATITVDYVPVASDDLSDNNNAGPVEVDVLSNDINGDQVVATTVQIVGTASAGDPLVVGGEGTWTVNPTTGAITFTPEMGYSGNPTPINYTVMDDDGNTSNQALVTVEYTLCVEIEAWVYLEGAAITPDGSQTYSLPMRTTLNDLRLLPGQLYTSFGTHYTPAGQPFDGAPWLYAGTEGLGYDSEEIPGMADAGYPSTVVDWVLVSLREVVVDPLDFDGDYPDDTPICTAAALLHSDGSIEFVDDFTCCDLDNSSSYYLVIEHRNHLLVASHEPLPVVDGKISYDFRNQQSFIGDLLGSPFGVGQKEVMSGVFAMYAGNGDQVSDTGADTDINVGDEAYWKTQNGESARYRNGDYNMNGDPNGLDRILWGFNNGNSTAVPRD